MGKDRIKLLLRNFLIELALYAVLVTIYFFVVLRLLGDPLTRLFHSNQMLYALAGLALILTQGVLLDLLTSFLLNRLKLMRSE